MIRELCHLRLLRIPNLHYCTTGKNELENIRTYEVEASLNAVSTVDKRSN